MTGQQQLHSHIHTLLFHSLSIEELKKMTVWTEINGQKLFDVDTKYKIRNRKTRYIYTEIMCQKLSQIDDKKGTLYVVLNIKERSEIIFTFCYEI